MVAGTITARCPCCDRWHVADAWHRGSSIVGQLAACAATYGDVAPEVVVIVIRERGSWWLADGTENGHRISERAA
ncbi:hypothetical protein FNH05_13405 [Amycolatopsis rhizosphaerae]|uniref:Uncharacterized protein n=1 Tax=Amycolatopsis rhizosphaerae TaxID=2053003 RepID=A0A558CTM3_9PSEU|nr:hypothetical protein [Amycolatopsis rhizosphaerae]TVT52131.1 hypothetical protein FNH05_13405 [Amycolatopsis rhizosphaerae]